jgi:hypothetical protein
MPIPSVTHIVEKYLLGKKLVMGVPLLHTLSAR